MTNRHSRTRLNLVTLEDRAVPATFTVTDSADTNTGDSTTGTLRKAINIINNSSDATNTIEIQTTGTITLSSNLPTITKPVAITGRGSSTTIIDGVNNGKRAFTIDDSANAAMTVSISGVTVRNSGDTNATPKNGGAIYSKENLTLNDVQLFNNQAVQGGGIYAEGGSLTLDRVVFNGNTASNAGGALMTLGTPTVIRGSNFEFNRSNSNDPLFGGGAVAIINSSLTATGVQFSNNSSAIAGGAIVVTQGAGGTATVNISVAEFDSNNVDDNGSGGAIRFNGGTGTITGATFFSNTAPGGAGNGGAIYAGAGANGNAAEVTITNSTLGNNIAGKSGGAVYVSDTGTIVTLRSSTVAFNTAAAAQGQLAIVNSAKATLINSIVANGATASTTRDVVGTLESTSTGNLIAKNSGLVNAAALAANSNLIGSQGSNVPAVYDPLFATSTPIANGGFTKTFALQAVAANPAKDAGVTDVGGLTTDQRGLGFARVVGPKVDIGAYEIPTGPITLVVNTEIDRDAPGTANSLSLREALRGLGTDATTIAFDPSLNGKTITLSIGALSIDRKATITGPGADKLTISGNDKSRVFVITDGDNSVDKLVNISGITITNGFTNGDGGGIYTQEALTLDKVVLTKSAANQGGGLITEGGTLTITNSTISNNKANLNDGSRGGGVYIANGGTGAKATVITQSTISGNQANGDGGGIHAFAGELKLNNSTITNNKANADNTSMSQGGGIRIVAPTTIVGSIIADNLLGTNGLEPDVSGTAVTTASLIGIDAGFTPGTGSSTNNLVGTNATPLSAKLGSLALNGGTTPTHLPASDSPAVNPGFDTTINPTNLTLDQRGSNRKAGSSIDIGAVEFAVNAPPTISDVANQTTTGAAVGPLAFTIGDAETPVDSLQVTRTSSNTALVPLANVVLAGTGANRTVTVTPISGLTGTATITLTVTDSIGATTSDTFDVVVTSTTTTPQPVLVGFKEFAAGSDSGAGNVIFFNPDGTQRFSITPFPGFTGGIRTASADFNGDGIADLVVGTGPGSATHLRILDGTNQTELFRLDPFEASFTGGIFVAAGDINGDGTPDLVITPDEGGGPRARVFNGKNFTGMADFFGIADPNFRGGARAAIGDINGDGKGDLIIAAGFGGGPRISVYDGSNLTSNGGPKLFGDFFAFEEGLRNGTFVTAGDINGDGKAELIAGAGPGGGPRVSAFEATALLGSRQVRMADFFAGDPNSRGGVRVAVKNLDSDNKADLLAGSGIASGSRVNSYLGKDLSAGNTNSQLNFDAFSGFTGGVFVG